MNFQHQTDTDRKTGRKDSSKFMIYFHSGSNYYPHHHSTSSERKFERLQCLLQLIHPNVYVVSCRFKFVHIHTEIDSTIYTVSWDFKWGAGIWEAGITQWLERRTRDRKVAGSSLGRSAVSLHHFGGYSKRAIKAAVIALIHKKCYH